MSSSSRILCLVGGVCLSLALASAQTQVPPCPGYNVNHNNNLACEIATTVQSGGSLKPTTLNSFSPTLATELSQLPTATAVSGSGLTVISSLGLTTGSSESLGTILTQRGETLGRRNKWFISLSYQRFDFSSIDGLSLKHLPIVDAQLSASGAPIRESVATSRIDLLVNQFTAIGSYALTDRLDLNLMVPFAQISLKTGSQVTQVASGGFSPQVVNCNSPTCTTFLAGSANGPGDITAGLKTNVVKGEHFKVAVGGDLRFPTGDESNYLGTGAYGFKPYVVLSRAGRLTPNINLAYQWNGTSVLNINPATGARQDLPSSFLYSGGLDFKWFSKLTLTGEFLGQAVINGPRLIPSTQAFPQGLTGSAPTVANQLGTYAIDNVGVGFKFNPYKGWLITANTLVALDEGGLRSKVVPLLGISYRWQ